MKKIISVLVIVMFFIVSSCTQDFLDVTYKEKILADPESLNSDAGAKALVTNVYAKFLDWNMSSFSWIGLTSIIDDNADKGSSPTDTGSDKHLLDNLQHTASSQSVKEVFTANYEGIARANDALEKLPFINGVDEDLLNSLQGETKFLRAFMYFNLVRLYGGVPIVDRVTDAENEADQLLLFQRKTVGEVYTFIIDDLNYAISVLPDRSAYPFDERGRVSKGSAYALLAKVQLYRQNWSEVINTTNQISGYSLTPNFADIYKIEGEFNVESLFEINGYGSGTTPKGIQQYAQTQGVRAANGGWGWGFNTPSVSLYQVFESGDVRRDVTMMYPGQTLYDGRVVPATAENPRYNYKCYTPLNPGADNNDTNIRYLRYAEVLLMKAEAYNELGNLTEAKNAINLVRTRAGLPNTSANNQPDLRLAIWNERRVELAMEHDRWFDLIRTGQAPTAMSTVGKTFIVGKHELFPIPQEVVDQSNGVTTQNPGY